MGVFDFLKQKGNMDNQPCPNTQSTFIPQNEKQDIDAEVSSERTVAEAEKTAFGKDIITFDQRKKISYPSERGLYVAEILLLEYCSYGSYPVPKDKYPRFWWYEYGLEDIDTILKSLEDRGFIRYATPLESVPKLTVSELKQILSDFNLPQTGKKADLVARVQESLTNEELASSIPNLKYVLTDLGEQELLDNEYVPYMHKIPDKTTDDATFGPVFNVWEINRRLNGCSASEWQSTVDDIRKEQADYQLEKKNEREELIREYEISDPEFAESMREQDRWMEASEEEIKKEQEAKQRYKDTGDINAYIRFWEDVWANGGPITPGSIRMFTLPDLYIKEKRYDDAMHILKLITDKDKYYTEKAESYMERVNKLKDKENS